MKPRSGRRAPQPLDSAALESLALRYVERFATSRGKLTDYLRRKLRERGWAGENMADPEAIADRLASLGYVDDSSFALSKARGLVSRGYGAGRVRQVLRGAGVAEADGEAARDLVEEERVEAAVRLAKRKRIGPFAAQAADRAAREKAIAAMLRAGHSLTLSRAIVDLPAGTEINLEDFRDYG